MDVLLVQAATKEVAARLAAKLDINFKDSVSKVVLGHHHVVVLAVQPASLEAAVRE